MKPTFTVGSSSRAAQSLSPRKRLVSRSSYAVGYPKPFPLKVKKAPDARAIDVHAMDWDAHHAIVHMDVEADNGEICKDRIRVSFKSADFRVTLAGLDREKNAQVIATPHDEDGAFEAG